MPPPSPATTLVSCAHSASSAANLFLQLAPPSRCSQTPVLDFLWPRAGIATHATRRPFRSSKTVATTAAARRTFSRRPAAPYWTPTVVVAPSPPPRAIFTPFMSARRFTQAIFNPQKDDDGNDMKLEITPRAAKRLSDIMRKDANPNLALRIQVESGGCHGFQYLMSLVTLPDSLPPSSPEAADAAAPSSEHLGEGADSGAIREDDTIFTYTSEEAKEDAVVGGLEVSGAPKIILDQPSLELLKGSKVDFTMELIGSQFKIVDNPLATSSCGCGTSFDIKI